MRTAIRIALSLALSGVVAAPAGAGGNCAGTSVGLTPLTDLGAGDYRGEQGGLYPEGSNEIPEGHLEAGSAWAETIGPMDGGGSRSPYGKYVFLSIGMSNTTQEFSRFVQLANEDPAKDPHLVLVDGAQGGATAAKWANPGDAVWTNVDGRLSQAGVSPQQVVAAWVKVANANPSDGWPNQADALRTQTSLIVRNLRMRYPNVRLAYLSSRTYAGYANTTLNPEPYAYESGFGMKWLIGDQLAGEPGLNHDPRNGPPWAPWLAWGPYLWADGVNPRTDGLTWACSDFGNDGTHPSEQGRTKVAQALLDFVKSDPTARLWFVGEGGITDAAGDANLLNQQGVGALPLSEYGPGTRPASIDGADLVRVRFQTTYDEVVERDEQGRPVRVRHEATGLRVRMETTGPQAPTFGPTLSYEIAVNVGSCSVLVRLRARGPQSAQEDPPQGAHLLARSAACPGGVRAYPVTLSLDDAVATMAVAFDASGGVLADGLRIQPEASGLRTRVIAIRQVAGGPFVEGPQIDLAPHTDPFVIGSDVPEDVECADQPAHPACQA